mmetsp:Transcript_23493/g.67112  ORF Transcript_23493/g.67112 Transcript_23493/m.67112 type:complete len:229 (+) Transcript_23493:1177-1863(+)
MHPAHDLTGLPAVVGGQRLDKGTAVAKIEVRPLGDVVVQLEHVLAVVAAQDRRCNRAVILAPLEQTCVRREQFCQAQSSHHGIKASDRDVVSGARLRTALRDMASDLCSTVLVDVEALRLQGHRQLLMAELAVVVCIKAVEDLLETPRRHVNDVVDRGLGEAVLALRLWGVGNRTSLDPLAPEVRLALPVARLYLDLWGWPAPPRRRRLAHMPLLPSMWLERRLAQVQ